MFPPFPRSAVGAAWTTSPLKATKLVIVGAVMENCSSLDNEGIFYLEIIHISTSFIVTVPGGTADRLHSAT